MAGTFDAPSLRRAMELYEEALREHRDEIDSLNVYPVPDGDTGTNMLLTQQAVVTALPPRPTDVATLCAAVSRASLLGARGNSGVILSQILRGLCEGLPAAGASSAEMARAIEIAAHQAHRAVARPADGTILSVIGDAARAAGAAAEQPLPRVIRAAVEEARAALERTREINPDLRAAGVVDAGGKGIVLFLQALRAAAEGDSIHEPVGPFGPVGRAQARADPANFPFAYEVQFLLESADPATPDLRSSLGPLGDSLVMVGGGGLYNVHIHANRPGTVLERALEAGRATGVAISYLPDHPTDCRGDQARAVRIAEQTCALVAVGEGAGVLRALRSLGAVVVVGGPAGMPSVGDLVKGIEAAPAPTVVLLPNHPNVRPAADRAGQEARKAVRVIGTTSIPAGLTAATAFNPTASLDENAEAMKNVASACGSVELARAERDAGTAAGFVRAGQWVATVEGRAVSVGDDGAPVLTAAIRSILDPDAELLTLVVGAGVDGREVESMVAAIEAAFPELRVDVLDGGQPRYPFLVGVE